MINYKKANAYFAKQIKKNEVFIWRPPLGGAWIADKYLAIFYYDQPLPFDPSQAKELPGIEKILANASLAVDPVENTAFLCEIDKQIYRVMSGRRLLRRDLADILGGELCYYKQRSGLGLYVVGGECDPVVGFACGYRSTDKMWEVLKNEPSCD